MLDEVKKVLGAKAEALDKILEITSEIKNALEEKNIERVVALLQLRQQEMDKVDQVDRKALSLCAGDFAVLMERVRNDMGLKNFYEAIQTRLKSIKSLDDQNMKKAQKLQAELSDDIKNIRHTGRALKGYGVIKAGPSSFGAFIDTKK